MVSLRLAEVRGTRPERNGVTKDRARKQAIRALMAASGEPYSVAARHLAGLGGADGLMAPTVAARARATLDEPGARIGIRLVMELPWVEAPGTPREQRRGGIGGVARRLLGTLLHDATHVAGEGFAEPAARRYMVDAGTLGGFVCRAGAVVQGRHGWRVSPLPAPSDQAVIMHWLWALWALTGAVAARPVGPEEVRGTACQHLIVEVDLTRALEAGGEGWPATFRPGPEAPAAAALAVWIDEEHVRRVRFGYSASGDVSPQLVGGFATVEVELWDFGTSVANLDWSRIP